MNSAPVIPPAKIRFYQFHGQGDGELCPTAGNDRQVMRFYPIQLDPHLRNPSASPLEKAAPVTNGHLALAGTLNAWLAAHHG